MHTPPLESRDRRWRMTTDIDEDDECVVDVVGVVDVNDITSIVSSFV